MKTELTTPLEKPLSSNIVIQEQKQTPLVNMGIDKKIGSSGKAEQDLAQKDFEWLNDKDRNICCKMAQKHYFEHELKGNRYSVFLEGLEPALPISEQIFTPQVRREKLVKILQIKDRETIAGGCSLIYQLFSDHFHYLSTKLVKETLKKRNSNKGYLPLAKNPHYHLFNVNFRLIIAKFATVENNGNLWTNAICHSLKGKNNLALRKDIANGIKELKNNTFINSLRSLGFQTPHDINEMLDVLADMNSQEFNSLYEPLDNQFDFNDHFKRLQHRIHHLKEDMDCFELTFNGVGYDFFKNESEERRTLRAAVEDTAKFFQMTEKLLSGSSKATGVVDLYHYLLVTKYDQFDLELTRDPIRKLIYLLTTKSYEKPDQALDIRSICYQVYAIKNAIIFEGILAALSNQLDKKEDFSEVDNFITNTILALEEIHKKPHDSIRYKLNALHDKNLSELEGNYFKTLYQIFLSINVVTKELTKCNIDLYHYRLKECRKPSAGHFERAQALRDIKVYFSVNIVINTRLHLDTLIRCRRTFYKDPNLLCPEIREVSDMLFEHLQMHMEISNGVEAQIMDLVNKEQEIKSAIKPKPRQERNKPSEGTKGQVKLNDENVPSKDQETSFSTTSEQQMDFDEILSPTSVNPDMPGMDLTSLRNDLKKLHAKVLQDPDHQRFFQANLRNIKHVIRHLEETAVNQTFSITKIFGETDSLRRLMEGVLGLAVIASSSKQADHPPLTDLLYQFGHTLNEYVIYIQESPDTPENIKQTVMQNWSIPTYFSQANACVNYLHTTRAKKQPPQAARLAHFLSLVESEAQNKHSNEDVRSKLLQVHQKRTGMATSFASELLHTIVDPNYKPESKEIPDLTALEKELEAFKLESTPQESMLQEEADALEILEVETKKTLLKRQIRTRDEAVDAIENALIWLRIRTLPPTKAYHPERYNEKMQRRRNRNLAFENTGLSLMLLKEKLQSEDESVLYDSIIEEMKILRRAHKELGIGYLYHGNFFKDGQHIIDHDHLRYTNNPCLINRVLRMYSAEAEWLPNLDSHDYKWLSQAHQWLTYPKLQWDWPVSKQNPWIQQIKSVVKVARNLSRRKRNAVASVQETVQLKQEIKAFVSSEEEERIFSAISALLQMVIYGMPISD